MAVAGLDHISYLTNSISVRDLVAVKITFAKDGAERHPASLSNRELELLEILTENELGEGPGARIRGGRELRELLADDGSLDNIAKSRLGDNARPVRAVLFDKTADSNWALGWHQDRTIVVECKRAVAGYGPWSKKAGFVHVEPPFDVISRMVTLRAHLDGCDEDNGPLRIVPGSHRAGRLRVDQTVKVAETQGSLTCTANAGDVWLYATAIVHASEASRKPKRRRVLQVDYSCDDLPHGLEWLGI